VTLGLLHGATPDYLLLCHHAGRSSINGYPSVAIPSLTAVRAMYETAAAWLKPTRTVGIVLNTFGLDDSAAREALRAAEHETGLPAADPVRFGAGLLVEVLESARAAEPDIVHAGSTSDGR
jgi:uncharacterized NAD-dependent epimerase/dehydratase family protein